MSTKESFSYLLEAEITDVWHALTEKVYLKYWFYPLPAFSPVEGFEFSLTAHSQINDYVHLCKILKINAPTQLTLSWKNIGYSGTAQINFLLEAQGAHTRLHVEHSGLDTFPKNHKELAPKAYLELWDEKINTSLRLFVERTNIIKEITIDAPKSVVWSIILDTNASWIKAFGTNVSVETDYTLGALVKWNNTDGSSGDMGKVINVIEEELLTVGFYDKKSEGSNELGKYYERITLEENSNGSTLLKIQAGPTRNTFLNDYTAIWDKALNLIKTAAENAKQ